MKKRLIPFLLAIVMIVGMLPTAVFAADDQPVMPNATGESYTIKNGAVKLFVPYSGYEGSEIIDEQKQVTWTVKGGIGTLSFQASDFFDCRFFESFWIDGSNYIKDVVIEVSERLDIQPKNTSKKACVLVTRI